MLRKQHRLDPLLREHAGFLGTWFMKAGLSVSCPLGKKKMKWSEVMVITVLEAIWFGRGRIVQDIKARPRSRGRMGDR